MIKENMNEKLLNPKEAAAYLGMAPGTLAVWDCTKRYDLKPLKVGRAVRYRRANLEQFLEVDEPIKLTMLRRSKLTTFFAGEDFQVQVYQW